MKYALIGCGRIAVNHIKAALNNHLEICAVCDVKPEAMETLLEKYGIEKQEGIRRYADYRELLAAERPTLASIATESGIHAEIALACIDAGVNVIIEKPMAMSMANAEEIIHRSEAAGVKVSACHQNRFNIAVQETRKALEAGRFGALSHGSVHVRWNRNRDYYDQAPWRGTWTQDGGCLMNQCIHGVDLLRWMMGDEVEEVYIILWNSLDLQTSLSYSLQADMEDKYLREIITLTRSDGGCLTLTVSGISEAETSRLAEAAYDCLIGLQSRISEGSYLHSFALLNDVTKVSVDNNLENTQTENLKKIRTYTDNIADLSKQLEELEEPKRETAPGPLKIVLSCVKYAVLGAVIGCLLALMCAMVSYLFRCRPETSRQIEEGLSIPFLGSVAKSGGFWDRMANRILSERLWADEDQALAYISASAATLLPVSECRDVLLISTLPLKAEEVGAVIKALENQNRTVRFVGGALRNPEAAEALKACGCVVLAERPGVTRWDDAIELTALSKNLERSVGGFVTV